MKFIIESIEVQLSDVKADKIEIPKSTHSPFKEVDTVDGLKYRHAKAIINMELSGDIENATHEDLLVAINEKLGRLIEIDA